MEDSLKIKVNIAGRVYPLKIKTENEEEGMRKAAKKINELVAKFEKNYEVSDKQDVLAMCALQFASQMEIEKIGKSQDLLEVSEKIDKLNALIDGHLKV
jgi:cell division protein ZapA